MTDPATTTPPAEETGAEFLAKKFDTLAESIAEIKKANDEATSSTEKKFEELDKRFEDVEKVNYPYGVPNGNVHGVITGESPNTSRPYRLSNLVVALAKRADHHSDWMEHAKQEIGLSEDLRKAYGPMGLQSDIMVPFATDLMPTSERTLEDGSVAPGVPAELKKRCEQVTRHSLSGFDPDEAQWIQKRTGLPIFKDLSANTSTTGGTLVGMASQGELIELLRAIEVFSRAGATEIDLPPQGRIRFPRVTSGVTIAAYAEAATVTESTPGTGALELAAKAYSGLVDIPEELIKFATSVAVEGWLRSEFVRDIALKTDSDMIDGTGGTTIQGVTRYSGVRTVTASTTGANGDTLDPEDPLRLYSDIADQDAPVDQGFFYALTNTLWGGLQTRKASSSGEFMFNIAANQVGGGMVRQTLGGHLVVPSTQVPTDRVKGSGTDLTMLLGGVGREWMIGRAGVIDIQVTNSDSTKFASRISTMRGTQYIDAGPRHENSFGYIDDLLNS